jgi:hypothetical protein
LKLDKQQSAVVDFKGDKLVVLSKAGTGKTTVLVGYATVNLHIPMLYICFNEAIQKEAKGRFPRNTTVKTIHAMAYAIVGVTLSHKLVSNLKLTDVKVFLGLDSWDMVVAIVATLNSFLCSSSKEIGLSHVGAGQKASANIIVAAAKKVWMASIDPNNPFPATHDVYLKVYCLSGHNLSRWFGVILFDEAQDANPVVSDFIYDQPCKHIVVGDSDQQLYRWRGADDSILKFRDKYNAEQCFMTQSFRFGNKVAKVASLLLEHKNTLLGRDVLDVQGLDSISDRVCNVLPAEILSKQHARLHRTVAGTIKTALSFPGRKVYWIGGMQKYNFQEILDVYHLSVNKQSSVFRKKLLIEFKSFGSYERASKSSGDAEMVRIVKMIADYGSSLPTKIAMLRKDECSVQAMADIIVGTAHRAKGLEFETVIMGDDFKDLTDAKSRYTPKEIGDEINLLYVGVTRAIKYLQVNDSILSVLKKVVGNDVSKYIEMDNKAISNAPSIVRPRGSGVLQRVALGD